MGLQKLDDVEYARRARERNNRISAVHRQRLIQSGRAQTNVWLPMELRARLELEAQTTGNLSTAVEQLLLDGLAYRANQTANPLPLFTPSETTLETTLTSDTEKPVDRDQQILVLHRQGLKNTEIGRQFGLGESAIRKIVQRLKAKELTQ